MYGDHQVGCGSIGDCISRHNAIRDVIFSAAQCAVLVASKEMPSLISNSLARPADICLPNWSCGRPAALNVHVISPLQQQTHEEAATYPGHALQVGVISSHLSACCSAGIDFIPLVAETLSGLAEDTILIIRIIGQAIGQRDAYPEAPNCTRHLFLRVAISLWRGNAILWLHHHPTLPPSLDCLV